MKFLHTADWHLGKMLHKYPLDMDMDVFFDWMFDTIKEHHIDTLLVAGDIFDISNPSILDRRRYYKVLSRLSTTCKNVIITGGNHDSAGMLNAPAELLEALNIKVVGGINKKEIENEIVPIYENDKLEAIILAVPYLRDRDIKQFVEGASYEDKASATRKGIIKHYLDLVQIAKNKYGSDVPLIAMGHLFLKGVSVSDSERDISIGNLDSVDHESMTAELDYMALGHIHRPQKVDKEGRILYSGSPIPLSFSERKDKKRVIIGSIKDGKVEVDSLDVPTFRRLIQIKGNLKEVSQKLEELQVDTPLSSLVELLIIEKNYDPSIPITINQIKDKFNEAPFTILKDRIQYENSPTKILDLYQRGEDIENLKPSEVFEKRLDHETSISNEDKELLRSAYQEILSIVQENQENL